MLCVTVLTFPVVFSLLIGCLSLTVSHITSLSLQIEWFWGKWPFFDAWSSQWHPLVHAHRVFTTVHRWSWFIWFFCCVCAPSPPVHPLRPMTHFFSVLFPASFSSWRFTTATALGWRRARSTASCWGSGLSPGRLTRSRWASWPASTVTPGARPTTACWEVCTGWTHSCQMRHVAITLLSLCSRRFMVLHILSQ